jgi:predicted lipid-binding transport protein (Tim44 family)
MQPPPPGKRRRRPNVFQDFDGFTSFFWAMLTYWLIYSGLSQALSPDQPEEEGWAHGEGASALAPSSGGAAPAIPAGVVREILRRDRRDTLADLLEKLLAMYEATIAAFDKGDRDALKRLVSDEVYAILSEAIAVREGQRQRSETLFSRMEVPQIVDGAIDETHMEVSIRFVSDSFKLRRDAAGDLLDGSDSKHLTVDVWTFERGLSAAHRHWRVAATQPDCDPPVRPETYQPYPVARVSAENVI